MTVNGWETRWETLADAAAEIGCSISTLYRLRASGLIARGVHWHRTGPGRRAPVVFNVPAVRLALQVFCSR